MGGGKHDESDKGLFLHGHHHGAPGYGYPPAPGQSPPPGADPPQDDLPMNMRRSKRDRGLRSPVGRGSSISFEKGSARMKAISDCFQNNQWYPSGSSEGPNQTQEGKVIVLWRRLKRILFVCRKF
ncbi:hypothetical protein OWV82_015467 [Melia azedarach]|uniref:Uncharacterized protein n=1 Tax=Melia azedarach TaxID=155640 RepID=A0ACC1XPG6_MELAZ|nr:hypothetical protein OWV82_015467 [Melia azedarach]